MGEPVFFKKKGRSPAGQTSRWPPKKTRRFPTPPPPPRVLHWSLLARRHPDDPASDSLRKCDVKSTVLIALVPNLQQTPPESRDSLSTVAS